MCHWINTILRWHVYTSFTKLKNKIIFANRKKSLIPSRSHFFYSLSGVNLKPVTATYPLNWTFTSVLYFTCSVFHSHLIKIFEWCPGWPAILHQIQNRHHASAFQLTQDGAPFKIPSTHLSVRLDATDETCTLVKKKTKIKQELETRLK